MIKYFTIEDLLKHYLQKKFHILFYTYREVFFIPNQGIVGNTYGKTIIRLTEAYPVSGRIWTNVYNTDSNDWTGWKSTTPV